MFDLELQRRIREKKTPLALTLAPEAEKLNGKFVKNFIDMFGDTPMAQAEALRQAGADQARDGIGGSAGREGHDDADGGALRADRGGGERCGGGP